LATDESWGIVAQNQMYVVTPTGFKNPPGPDEGAGVLVDPFRFLITGPAGEHADVMLNLPDSFVFNGGTESIPITNWTYGFGDYEWCDFGCFGAVLGETLTVPINRDGTIILRFGATLSVPVGATLGPYTAAVRVSFTGKDTIVYRSLESIASTDVEEEQSVPRECDLRQNYPNPFNPSTTISYALPTQGFVSLKVFNVLGQEVAILVNGIESPGSKSVTLDGSGLPSGVYFYRLQAGSYSSTKMLMVVR
jgi:hypothetical protein